jgi:imidazolonepropionase
MRADFVHWRVRRPSELCYWLGGRLAHGVFAGGRRIA